MNDSSKTKELKFVGGLKDHIWLDNGKFLSRNFKQGYRVYSTKGICATLTSEGGGLGGTSGLYLVKKKNRKDNQ